MRCVAALLGVAFLTLAHPAWAESETTKALRQLQAPPASVLVPLPAGAKAKPIRLTKVVLQQYEGDPWALLYMMVKIAPEGAPRPPADTVLTWQPAAMNDRLPAFAGAFESEAKKAGIAAGGQDVLFGDPESADLQIGVVVQDVRARYCMDCPNIFQREKVAAVAVMKAHWEIYSASRGQVIARIDTEGGVTQRERPQTTTQTLLAAFQDNVRRLIATKEFRDIVTGEGSGLPAREPFSPISFRPATVQRTIASAPDSVAVVFAGAAMGSAFLISDEGYLITNHHVVGEATSVRIRWSDRSETVGQVVRSDVRRDVALIKVADAHGRAPLRLRAEGARLGEPVFAIGTPLDKDMQNTLTKGVVSASRVYEGLSYIQSDVAIDHGNSGGPLVDESGQVLGISDWFYSPDGTSHNLNFFIPIGDALGTLALQPAANVAPPSPKRAAAKKHS
jgi:S1-C subfamily serine protease